MKRTIAYIDGSNLYYGLLRGGVYKWLDLTALVRKLIGPRHELQVVKYFTSRVIDKTPDHHKSQRQDKYLDALRNYGGVKVFEGRYREQKELSFPAKEPCLSCDKRREDGRVKVFRITEKLTDVNIALQMVKDAFQDNADEFVLITGDADVTPAARMLKYELDKPLLIFNPQQHISNELRKYSSVYANLTEAMLEGCRLPDHFATSTGRVIHCPTAWLPRKIEPIPELVGKVKIKGDLCADTPADWEVA